MDVLRNQVHAAKPQAFETLDSSQNFNKENIQQELNTRHQNQHRPAVTGGKLRIRHDLISPDQGANSSGTNQPIIGSQLTQVGSCITARRRIGRTQRGQDPLSYRIGSMTFHTFRAMDPDNGCLCPPSQSPRCTRPCIRVLEMRLENYLNSQELMQMPEELRRKMIGHRDPVAVLTSRAHKYNRKFIIEKTEQNQQHVFEEMIEMDSIVRLMEEARLNK